MTSSFLAAGPPFSVESLAAELEVSTTSVRRLLPKIGYVKFGGLVRIPRENVEAYLAGQYFPPKDPTMPRRRSTGQPLADLVDAAAKRVRERGR